MTRISAPWNIDYWASQGNAIGPFCCVDTYGTRYLFAQRSTLRGSGQWVHSIIPQGEVPVELADQQTAGRLREMAMGEKGRAA